MEEIKNHLQPEETDIEESNTSNFKKSLKSIADRIQISRLISFIIVVGMTIVFSLMSAGWNPLKINWGLFGANITFLLFLGIFGLLFGESFGESYYKKTIGKAFQFSRDQYLEVVDRISVKKYLDALADYLPWKYEKDCQKAYKTKLLSVRLFNEKILTLTDEQIEKLRKESIEVNVNEHYSKITEEQYKVIQDIRGGLVKVDYIDNPNFYINETDLTGEDEVSYIKTTEKRKEKIKWQQRASKLALIVFFSIISAGLIVDTLTEQSAGQTILNLFTRLTTLTTSVICGVNTSRLMNMEDVKVIKHKTAYLKTFEVSMDNKTFIPESYEEKAKREYEEQEKSRQSNNY